MPRTKARRVIRTYETPEKLFEEITRSDERTLLHQEELYQHHVEEIKDSPITIRAYQNLTIRCNKTGKPFARRSMDDWNHLRTIHGSTRAEHILETNKLQAVSPEWLFTDDAALRSLAKYDPHGYFVYAATCILIPVQDTILRNKAIPHQDKVQFQLDWLEQKAKLWDNLQAPEIEVSEILRANDLMRKYLSVFRTAKVAHMLPFKCSHIPPEILGTEKKTLQDWIEEITVSIRSILQREVRARRVRASMTESDISNLRTHYEGHGNFRRQRSNLTGEEMLSDALQKFLPADFMEYIERRENTYGLKHVEPEPQRQTFIKVKPKKGFKLKFAAPSNSEKKED